VSTKDFRQRVTLGNLVNYCCDSIHLSMLEVLLGGDFIDLNYARLTIMTYDIHDISQN
jgi:hypothetical protein